jgi:hypothetical protein
MKFKSTLILLIIVVVLFAFVYIFEIRKPKESTGESDNLGKLLSLAKEDVNKVELAYSDPNYEGIVCSKDDAGEWQIEQPLKAKADQKLMDRLISDTVGKYVHETLKEAEDISEYGLDNPRVTATFYLQDGTSRTIMLGDTVPTRNYVYVKQKAVPDISLVTASIADDLTKFPSDLRDRTVITLDKSAIRKIRLKYADRENIVCQKTEAEWNLLEPMGAKGEKGAIGKIISDLGDLKVDRFITEEAEDVSIYGLSQPQIEATVTLDDGVEKSLLIGKEEDGSVYVKRASDKAVYSVNADIIDKLKVEPSDLRDRTVVAFDRNLVEKLELRSSGRSVVMEKKQEEGRADLIKPEEFWEITKPDVVKADKSTVDEILKKLDELKVDEFASDDPEDLSIYGLIQPQIQAVIYVRESEPKTLLVGKKTGESVYVKTASEKSVYLVDAGIVDDLSKGMLDLRDKEVLDFTQGDVKRLELKRKDKTIVCIKQEHDWRIIEPVKQKAENYKVDNILSKIDEMKTEKFVAEEASQLSEYGLDQPNVEVTLTFKDDKTEKLLVGKKLPESESAYGKLASGKVVFVIPKDVLDELYKDVDDIREKK